MSEENKKQEGQPEAGDQKSQLSDEQLQDASGGAQVDYSQRKKGESAAADLPVEDFTLNYQKIDPTYNKQEDGGDVGTGYPIKK